MTILVVDNYDSFTYNLVEYVSQHGIDVEVLKNTASLDEVRALAPDGIVISPGPGHPKNDRDVGVSLDVLRRVSPDVPTLGVCLGLEAAVYEYGGTVGRAPCPIHGKAFPVDHDEKGVYRDIEQGFQAGRYHSLVATRIPDCFDVTATTDVQESDDIAESGADAELPNSLVMGVRHEEYPIECIQFHPESVLTGVGHDVVDNFLAAL